MWYNNSRVEHSRQTLQKRQYKHKTHNPSISPNKTLALAGGMLCSHACPGILKLRPNTFPKDQTSTIHCNQSRYATLFCCIHVIQQGWNGCIYLFIEKMEEIQTQAPWVQRYIVVASAQGWLACHVALCHHLWCMHSHVHVQTMHGVIHDLGSKYVSKWLLSMHWQLQLHRATVAPVQT